MKLNIKSGTVLPFWVVLALWGCSSQNRAQTQPVGAQSAANKASSTSTPKWNSVWNVVRESSFVPQAAREVGPPLRDGESVLFRFRAPADTQKVFLAGSWNGFAHNVGGAIVNQRFAMTAAGNGLFFKRVTLEPKTGKYKIVVLDKSGNFTWVSDPEVKETDKDGNTVVDFGAIGRVPGSKAPIFPAETRQINHTDPTQPGQPLRDGDNVLFRFRAPEGATKVYVAGSWNNFANNKDGKISDDQFAMTRGANGLWTKKVGLGAQTASYKFAVLDENGKFNWVSDPSVAETDQSGNTTLDFGKLERVSDAPPAPKTATTPLAPSRPKTLPLPTLIVPAAKTGKKLDVQVERVWARPSETNAVLVTLGPEAAGAQLRLQIFTPLGVKILEVSSSAKRGKNRLQIAPLKSTGGFLARVTLSKTDRTLAVGETVVSSLLNVEDDLRYGFYATYPEASGDADARAAMLAQMHVNAVEFYDYFPAHGDYAPREASYKFEPFGIAINARDVQKKINAGRKHNVLSIAYVAAYAASQSVYREYPFPMTDENGIAKVFNGQVMTETEAERQNKAKWFWLMDVSAGSRWHSYILDNFGRALDDSPNDLVSFDGFELDTYGDSGGTKFYAKDSKRNGDLLSDVLRDFVRDVRDKTRQVKPHGLVSFNSVNEFGVEKMSDVTDFGFLEIWNFYSKDLEELVDICFQRRSALPSKRVVLKVYPADMTPRQTTWPAAALRRVLGATMTGAGSLMVAGEPDEKKGRMHGLNSLFYPDHQPLSREAEKVLRDYYRFDALMFGITHGRTVENTALENRIPGCITRTYAVPNKQMMVVQILNTAEERQWTSAASEGAPRQNLPVSLDLPGGVAPQSVLFASPDAPEFQTPVKLDFAVQNGQLKTTLPELQAYGTLIFRY